MAWLQTISQTACGGAWRRARNPRPPLPLWIAWLETISETTCPAPWRRACMRMHQLPIPASGASSSRFGTVSGPSRQLVRSVASMDETQTLEGQQVVHAIDGVREGHDHVREATGGDRRRVGAELRAQAADDPVDLARIAVDDAVADRVARALADEGLGRDELDPRQARRPRGERLERDLDARGDERAEQRAIARDDVVGDRRAEVDDDAGVLHPLVGRDRVDEPVGAELARIVDPDRHPRPPPRADDEQFAPEVPPADLAPLDREGGHGRGDDRRVEVGELEPPQAEQAGQLARQLVRGLVADRPEAPVLDELAGKLA